MATPLDTLQIVKRLKEAGFDEPQAEALTTVFRDLRNTDLSPLATKTDLERLETRLSACATKTDLDRVESTLEVKIAEMKVDVIRWVFGIAFAQVVLVLAVLKLFPSTHP